MYIFLETFYVELPLLNPLSIPISLRNIRLKFDGVDGVEGSIVSLLELQPEETKIVRMYFELYIVLSYIKLSLIFNKSVDPI